MEITEAEEKKEKKYFYEDNLRDPRDNIKHTNICIKGVPEGKEREKGVESIFEDMITENFPNLGKETDIQVQEAQRVLNRINPRRTILGHYVQKIGHIYYYIYYIIYIHGKN